MENVHSPELGNRRDVLVYLPPSYRQSARSYPVLYMQDGQNLFDPSTSYAGEWGVGRAMNSAARRGLEAIVVGVPNMGAERMDEYSPYPDTEAGGWHMYAFDAAAVPGHMHLSVPPPHSALASGPSGRLSDPQTGASTTSH